MKDKGNKVQLSKQQRAELFVREYQTLCEKHGFQINVNPAFKSRDDGTYSVVLQTGIGELPKEEKKVV